MTQAVIFDLDFTLFDASKFYVSAFREMGGYLSDRFKKDADALSQSLVGWWRKLTSRNENYLDAFLRHEQLPAGEKQPLLSILWHHEAALELYEDAQRFLEHLPRGLRTAIVSDGNGIMQRHKVRSLDLVGRLDPIVFTSDFGPAWQKPSPLPIRAACHGLRLDPADVVYVGTDPYLDAVGPHRLGMPSVRLRRGEYADHFPPQAALFDAEISELSELLREGFLAELGAKVGS